MLVRMYFFSTHLNIFKPEKGLLTCKFQFEAAQISKKYVAKKTKTIFSLVYHKQHPKNVDAWAYAIADTKLTGLFQGAVENERTTAAQGPF